MNKRRCSLQEFPYYPYCDQYKGEAFDVETSECLVRGASDCQFIVRIIGPRYSAAV